MAAGKLRQFLPFGQWPFADSAREGRGSTRILQWILELKNNAALQRESKRGVFGVAVNYFFRASTAFFAASTVDCAASLTTSTVVVAAPFIVTSWSAETLLP